MTTPKAIHATDHESLLLTRTEWQELRVMLLQRFTWVLMFAYTLLVFRPFMPLAVDAMAHTFWKTEHMMTVHEVNGKFHIHYEMTQASKQNEKQKHQQSTKFQIAECIPILASSKHSRFIPNAQRIFYDTYGCSYQPYQLLMDYPPPQFPASV